MGRLHRGNFLQKATQQNSSSMKCVFSFRWDACKSWDSVVGVATRYGLDGPGCESQKCEDMFSSRTLFRTALGFSRPRIELVPHFFAGGKAAGD
jgi:hypothetical protein